MLKQDGSSNFLSLLTFSLSKGLGDWLRLARVTSMLMVILSSSAASVAADTDSGDDGVRVAELLCDFR